MEKQKAGQFLEASQVIAQAVGLDQGVALIVDAQKATRDVLQAVMPAKWMRTETDVEAILRQQQAKQEQAQLMALMEQGAGIAKTASETAANVSTALPQFGVG